MTYTVTTFTICQSILVFPLQVARGWLTIWAWLMLTPPTYVGSMHIQQRVHWSSRQLYCVYYTLTPRHSKRQLSVGRETKSESWKQIRKNKKEKEQGRKKEKENRRETKGDLRMIKTTRTLPTGIMSETVLDYPEKKENRNRVDIRDEEKKNNTSASFPFPLPSRVHVPWIIAPKLPAPHPTCPLSHRYVDSTAYSWPVSFTTS